MAAGRVHVITSRRQTGGRPLGEVVAAALAGGAAAIQLREKDLSGRDLWETAVALAPLCAGHNVSFIINDRMDVALGLDAAGVFAGVGVHLGEASLPVAAARRLLGPGRLIGASVHGMDGALRAEAEGADYLTFGHVFATGSKPGLAPRGLDELAAVCRAVSVPVVAVGGLSPANVGAAARAGAAGVAVISYVMGAADPAAAVRELDAAWPESTGYRGVGRYGR